jgi:hypothetical protein
VLFIEPSEWGFLPLRMGAGQAAAGRPLGATVEVRLQRHGASGRGTVSKRHCSNSFFFLLLLLYIFFYLWGPKNELQQTHILNHLGIKNMGIVVTITSSKLY